MEQLIWETAEELDQKLAQETSENGVPFPRKNYPL